MTSTPDRIAVAFAGEGSGEDVLSWGQKENWSAVLGARFTWLPLGGVKPLDPGTSLEDIQGELRYLLGRYQVLRTLIVPGPDGSVRQRVHASGEVVLEVHDAGGADPAALADEILERYRATPLDFAAEWPIRMGIVRAGGALTHMAVLMSHFSLDAAGAAVMMAEVAVQDPTPVTGMQPLAQAAWQTSSAGVRHNAAAMRHWEGILRSVPLRRFPEQPAEIEGPRYWHAGFRSPVMLPAVQAIAAASGFDTSAVLFALYAVGVRTVAGVDPVVVRPIVGNRFRPGHAGVVCTVAQAGLAAFDIGGASFPEALALVHKAALTAYKYSYYDHDDMTALRGRVARERGAEVEIGCFFNDRRSPSVRAQAAPAGSFAERRAAAGPSSFTWIDGQDAVPFDPLFAQTDDVDDAVQFSFHLDLRHLSRAQAEQLAWTMEREAVGAADDL